MIDEILLSDEDFTMQLLCNIDDKMKNIPKHSQANLYPGEVVIVCLERQWETSILPLSCQKPVSSILQFA